MRGPLGWFFRGFNRVFEQVMGGYLDGSHFLIRKAAFAILLLLVVAAVSGLIGIRLPGGFVPEEDQGYFYVNAQLPLAASLERTAGVMDKLDAILKDTPGVKYYTGGGGFSLLSAVSTTYNGFYFVSLEPWDQRNEKGLTADVIIRDLNRRRSEEHTSELQSRLHLVCRLLLEKKKKNTAHGIITAYLKRVQPVD